MGPSELTDPAKTAANTYAGQPAGRTLLIPFVAPIIGEVDIQARRICADWAADY